MVFPLIVSLPEFGSLIGAVASFSHSLGEYLLQGKATSNLAPVGVGESK